MERLIYDVRDEFEVLISSSTTLSDKGLWLWRNRELIRVLLNHAVIDHEACNEIRRSK